MSFSDATAAVSEELAGRDIYELEERYVSLFDRSRTLSLNLFEHVHGESRDRGGAMVSLIETYRAGGFEPATTELPDHLPVLLEFLSTRPFAEVQETLADAAHILDLSDLPQADQAVIGTERAFQLSVLMERKVVVPWRKLADRPDGWLSGSAEDNDTGRVRRSLLIDRLELGGHDVPLRLNRIKPGEDAEPVWVFSRQSIDNIPHLHAQYGPTDLETMLPDWLRIRAFWGMYLWEVLFLPLLVVGALMAGWFAFGIMRRLGDCLSPRGSKEQEAAAIAALIGGRGAAGDASAGRLTHDQ